MLCCYCNAGGVADVSVSVILSSSNKHANVVYLDIKPTFSYFAQDLLTTEKESYLTKAGSVPVVLKGEYIYKEGLCSLLSQVVGW